ncbi:MAG: hypothetical protein V4819_16240 [Verrucomicrobiota bacterium]
MTLDPTSLEAQLRELQAAALDDALLLRLEAAADGTLTQPSQEEIRFEALLRRTSPARLSPDFLAQLEVVVHEVPFAVNEKIVMFPKANTATHTHRKRPVWGAAAAVALIGAASALMIPAGKAPEKIVRQGAPVSPPATRTTNSNFAPASFNRGVSEVHDEGVVWKSNTQPHSLVRVVYKDNITLKDKEGRTFQIEQPRVEYMLVPAKSN